jgi:hypothetical protein
MMRSQSPFLTCGGIAERYPEQVKRSCNMARNRRPRNIIAKPRAVCQEEERRHQRTTAMIEKRTGKRRWAGTPASPNGLGS